MAKVITYFVNARIKIAIAPNPIPTSAGTKQLPNIRNFAFIGSFPVSQ
ncbi:MAG: hypothetical protein WBC73_21410 [Phormidesmis sp.]